jgi:hypothetical protein
MDLLLQPLGLAELYRKTGLPVVAHNRYWATDNVYATVNGGGYAFITEAASQRALPDDPNFWPDLFSNNSDWGLAVYEQGCIFWTTSKLSNFVLSSSSCFAHLMVQSEEWEVMEEQRRHCTVRK